MERMLELKNREGKSLTVCLRQYRKGDERGIIECIRDEYGDTYFKRNLYLPKQIQKEARSGHMTFLVAETLSGELAGMLILKQFYPSESMCELASQIFKKQYRGYGLAMPFFEYGMDILKSRHYSAAYCLPVLFHDTTQRLLYRMGLRATGFVLNVFHMEKIIHSYKRDCNKKHSQGIQIMAVEKRNAGIVYLPLEHREFGQRVYDSLGAVCHIWEEATEGCGRKEDSAKKFFDVSKMEWKQDAVQSSLEIYIHRVGGDLPRQMEKLHRKYPLKGMQTINVFLNINDPNAPWAYRVLTEMEYFFTGLKPLCSDKEYMVLHNAGMVESFLDEYQLSEEFDRLRNYIKRGRKK